MHSFKIYTFDLPIDGNDMEEITMFEVGKMTGQNTMDHMHP